MKKALKQWYRHWNAHNLTGVMSLLHEHITFDNWSGNQIAGKRSVERSWNLWFLNHGDFHFEEIETFIDEHEQKALFRWKLTWPSNEKGYEGEYETREGVDVLHFQGDKIREKLTFTKTGIEINQKKILLSAPIEIRSPKSATKDRISNSQ